MSFLTRALFGAAVISVAMQSSVVLADDGWRVVEISGTARVARPGQADAMVAANDMLPVGSTVTTAGNARVVLSNGAQQMTVSANSRMTVAPDSSSSMTRILEDLGTVLFQVDKRTEPHFRVETPLLAAVVKGTTFTVTSGTESDAVHVAEGLVEVHSNQGNAIDLVPSGATARILRDAPAALNLTTASRTPDAPTPDAPRVQTVDIPSLDYKDISGGLVEAVAPPKPSDAPIAPVAQRDAAPAALADVAPVRSELTNSILRKDPVVSGRDDGRDALAALEDKVANERRSANAGGQDNGKSGKTGAVGVASLTGKSSDGPAGNNAAPVVDKVTSSVSNSLSDLGGKSGDGKGGNDDSEKSNGNSDGGGKSGGDNLVKTLAPDAGGTVTTVTTTVTTTVNNTVSGLLGGGGNSSGGASGGSNNTSGVVGGLLNTLKRSRN